VTVIPEPVARVELSASASSVAVGLTVTLTAIARDSGNAVLSGRVITWTSANPAVATVSSTGVVTGVTVGSATISATTDGVSAPLTISVTPGAVARVELSPDSTTVELGRARALAATLRDASGTVLTDRTVTWSSSASAVATVTVRGEVNAIAIGRAIISATAEGRTATAVIVVATAQPKLVVVSLPATIAPGIAMPIALRIADGLVDTTVNFGGTVTVSVAVGAAASLIGTANSVARNGVVAFDDIALSTAGTYRLRFSAAGFTSVETGDIVVRANAAPAMTISAVTRTLVTTGIPGVSRYAFTITLRDGNGVVGSNPPPVVAAVARGSATIQSGETGTSSGTGVITFAVTVRGSSDFDLRFTAAGWQSLTNNFSSPVVELAVVGLSRAARDSVVPVGQTIALTALVQSQSGGAAVHSIVMDVSWNPDQLTLEADTTLVSSAAYSFNRTSVANGVYRITVASQTPLLTPAPNAATSLLRIVLRVKPDAIGRQQVFLTAPELRGAASELLVSRTSSSTSFRVSSP